MSKLDFAATIIQAILSWPVVVFLIVLLLRGSLSKLLARLSRLTYKGLGQEIDLSADIDKLQSNAQKVSAEQATKQGTPNTRGVGTSAAETGLGKSQFEAIAAISPSAAIVAAWAEVEQALNSAIMRLAASPDYPAYNSALRNIQLLEEQKYITPAFAQLLRELREVRNKAAHASANKETDGKSVPYVNALNYWQVANDAVPLLSLLSR